MRHKPTNSFKPAGATLVMLSLGVSQLGWTGHAHADGSFRCDARIVREGASRLEVRQACGTPDDVQQGTETRTVQRQVMVPCQAGLCSSYVNESVTVQVEEWTYDFGKQRFMQFLTFEAGKVIRIRSGGYGHKLPE
jgi:hypothetical protein